MRVAKNSAAKGLLQCVTGTHHTGHTLDVVITQTATEVFMSVEPPSISDHSVIVSKIIPGHTIQSVSATIVKRKWTQFDVDKFEKEFAESDLITSPPRECREYFTRYDKTLRELLDKHAALKSTVQRSRATAPWFNSLCRQVKVKKNLWRSYIVQHTQLPLSGMEDPVQCPATCVPDSLHRLLVDCNRELF